MVSDNLNLNQVSEETQYVFVWSQFIWRQPQVESEQSDKGYSFRHSE